MKNKIIAVMACFLVLFSLPLSASAQEYGVEYPNYINYSGGAFIEVQCSLGRGTIVLQDTYKSGYIGFSGSGYSVCNISSGNITGRFVLQNGTEYTCRLSSFSEPQYYYDVGMNREYRDLDIINIYNTNVDLIDYTGRDRGFDVDVFDRDTFKYTVVICLFVIIVINLFSGIRSFIKC